MKDGDVRKLEAFRKARPEVLSIERSRTVVGDLTRVDLVVYTKGLEHHVVEDAMVQVYGEDYVMYYSGTAPDYTHPDIRRMTFTFQSS